MLITTIVTKYSINNQQSLITISQYYHDNVDDIVSVLLQLLDAVVALGQLPPEILGHLLQPWREPSSPDL